jgi:hypothetical protein
VGRAKPVCPIHGSELICPTCNAARIGALGGSVKSKAKTAANRLNAESAGRPRLYPKCKRYRSHIFNKSGRCPCGFKRRVKPTK